MVTGAKSRRKEIYIQTIRRYTLSSVIPPIIFWKGFIFFSNCTAQLLPLRNAA